MLRESTIDLMRTLAQSVRDGTRIRENQGRSDSELLYGDLVKNGFSMCLARAFPIAKKQLSQVRSDSPHYSSAWDHLVGDFISQTCSPTPYLWQMPRELVTSPILIPFAHRYSVPWLEDLLSFEWTEIEVSMMSDEHCNKEAPRVEPRRYTLNPHHKIFYLRHPVFLVTVPEEWSRQGHFFVCCFRPARSNDARYIQLDPLLVSLIERWGRESLSTDQILAITTELAPPSHREQIEISVTTNLTILKQQELIY